VNDMLLKTINLNTIFNNIKNIEKETEKIVIPVIKSNAYGHGMVKVFKYLVAKKYKLFGVATYIEAVELLKLNLNVDILIFNSLLKSEYKLLNKYDNVIFSINKKEDYYNINLLSNKKAFIQVDSGMNRAGFKNIDEFNTIVKTATNIIGVYTHTTDDTNVMNQNEIFKKFINNQNFTYIHLGGSSVRKYEVCGNYIRVGLDIYGTNQNNSCLKVSTTIKEIREIDIGESVGYSRKYIAPNNCKIAVLDVGYNDGLNRKLTDYKVLINNKFYSIIGKICMNHMFILIDESVKLNDEVVFFSIHHPIEDYAAYIQTTPYEAFCMIKNAKMKYEI